MAKLKVQREFMLLLALLTCLFFLWIVSSTKPAYADNGLQVLDPGDGGGGGPPPPSNTIEGWVINRRDGSFAVGLTVYLYYGEYGFETTTDANGHFVFQGAYICPNWDFLFSLNGERYSLGDSCDDARWGQWFGGIHTNDVGYGSRNIFLEPAAKVNVTAAALFSNSQYATLYYGRQTEHTFSHGLSFHVPILGISTGYTTSETVTYSVLFECAPNTAQHVYRTHYASTYYDEIIGDVVASGITDVVANCYWGSRSTHEYLDSNSLPTNDWGDFTVAPGAMEWEYRETGSHTWSASDGVPFAIIYAAFSRIINLDITVTVATGTTTWVRFRIENPTGHDLCFRAYTPGARPDPPDGELGGMELHVWQIG
jgi:hypothetical protein